MKITAVELTNFLSHEHTRLELNGSKFVSLVGPNGAGKSSVLDGALFALYDAARGKTDDLVRLGATDMSSAVEFDYAGGTYRVVRGRTTRAGGRSSLELQARVDDGWRPLTGQTIRETQDAIEHLLHADAATFTSAVFLRQGQISQFVEATPAERKRVLGSILSLDIYAAAEAAARERALELSQEQRGQQARAQQLDEALARLPEARDAIALRAADVDAIAEQMAAANAERAAADKRLQELAGLIAGGEAAEAEAIRIADELVALRDRYRRAQARRESAERMRDMAATTLAAEASVREAAARIPDLGDAASLAETREQLAHELDERIRRERDAHQATAAEADRAYVTWQAQKQAATRRVDELAAAVAALEPLECPNCHHRWHEDQAGLQGKLDAGRRELRDLEAAEPKAAPGSRTAEAAIAGLERRRAELGDVRAALAEARGDLSAAQSQAARLEAMEQAKTTRAAAIGDMAAADAELASLNDAGKAAGERLATVKATAAETQGFRAERMIVTATQGEASARLTELGRQHADALADVGRLRASIEQLEALAAEREELTAALEATSTAIARERKLVTAFGVTGIPARIIESVLPELTAYASELLAELRPGMELSIRAQRAKKDGKGVVEALDLVVRDAAGERPLALFSGGERMSVSLAVAVGLSRLVARRAGAALRTLVIDEPDGLDADARRSFGQALRVLAHRGELARVVLVSHHEDLAEAADEIYRVAKDATGSHVELVA